MNDRIKLALGIVGAACLAGVLADCLLRATPWGINVILWLIPAVVAGALLARQRSAEHIGRSSRLVIPLAFFALALAWRDSPVLRWLDVEAIIALSALMASGTRLGRIPVAGTIEIGKAILRALNSAALGSGWLVGQDIRWKEIAPDQFRRHGVAIVRGLILTVPLLILFGTLFDSADDVFHGYVVNLLHVDADQTGHHLLVAAAAAWIVGGFLRALLLPELPTTSPEDSLETAQPLASGEPPRMLGITELSVVMGSLTALFALFVAIQFRYLFGGHPIVKNTPYRTYAEYAHKGFFELTAVAAIVLPLLLIADSVLRDRDMRSLRIFRTLAMALTGLVFVIIASAYQRMSIYQWAYGFTELRLYVVAFIAWLAAVFVWLMLTVLTGRRSRFTAGAFAFALIWIAALHVVNPDDWIVRANFDPNRMLVNSKVRIDIAYLAGLSSDAAGALSAVVEDRDSLFEPTEDERQLVRSAFERWQTPGDWRTWNWSRMRARKTAASAIQKVAMFGRKEPARLAATSIVTGTPIISAPSDLVTQHVRPLPDEGQAQAWKEARARYESQLDRNNPGGLFW